MPPFSELRVPISWPRLGRWTAAVVVSTIGITTGASTAIFSVFSSALSDTPSVARPDELVRIWGEQTSGGPREGLTYEEIRAIETAASNLSSMAAFREREVSLGTAPNQTRVRIQEVSPAYFLTLNISPVAGRHMLDSDASEARIAAISQSIAKREYSGIDTAIGQRIVLNGEAHTVVSVVADSFWFPHRGVQVWAAWREDIPAAADRSSTWQVIGRVRHDVDATSVEATFRPVADELRTVFRKTSHWRLAVRPFSADDARRARLGAVAVLGPTLLTLLLGCVNVSNLLLARAMAREREFAIRAAVGASRWQLVSDLLAHSACLGLLSAMVGAAVAMGLMRVLSEQLAVSNPLLGRPLTPSWTHFVYFGAITAIATVLCGVLPARYAGQRDLVQSLVGDAAQRRRHADGYSLSDLLVLFQVASATLLLGVTVVLGAFIAELYGTSLVSSPRSLFVAELPTRDSSTIALADLRRVAWPPEVTNVALADVLPTYRGAGRAATTMAFQQAGEPEAVQLNARLAHVSAGYFETVGATTTQGRVFSATEESTEAPVCVVNDRFATLYAPDRSVVGARIRVESPGSIGTWFSIVGVVVDVTGEHRILSPAPAAYVPLRSSRARPSAVFVRSAIDAPEVARRVTNALAAASFDGLELESMADHLSAEVVGSRFVIELIAIFTGTAMLLAGLGLAASMVWYVQDRRREIAIRIAVGAHPRLILWFVGKRAFALIVTGAIAGAGVAAIGTWFGWRELAYATAFDPYLWGVLVIGVVTFAAAALLIPARAAVHVEPVSELRAI